MLRRTRRSPTACSWCRYRKVRCDASILGSPCTRCRQDGRSECILRAQNPKQSPKSPKSRNPVLPAQQSLDSTKGRPSGDRRQSHARQNLTSQLRAHGLNFDDCSDSSPELPDIPYTEYAFVESRQLLSLPSKDIAFLTSEGCLSLPASNAIHEFVEQYFKRIHPMVPVLDEAEFWRIYLNTQSTGPTISLFVLQSMLFASCPFVSLKTLRQCGFYNKRDARKQLYNRAKLLFELRTEKQCHINAQGAVLLTHYTSADDTQSGSLWVTRAIEHAMLVDAEPLSSMDNVRLSLKKRLWWSILLRDRSLSIGLCRRPQVTSISLHGWSDWLSTEDFEEELHQSRVYDYDTKMRLLEALQKQCELAVLLTDLVNLAFTQRKTPRRLLSMIEFQGLLLRTKRIKISLNEWEQSSQPLIPSRKTPLLDGNEAVESLTYMTFMYYHAARVKLAHYAAFILEENVFYAGDQYGNLVLEISDDLRNGIQGLSVVMEHFSVNGYSDSLPLSVLGYVSMPLLLAAIDLKLSPSREQTQARQRRLNSLSQIIRHSETLYDVTDCVAVATNHLLQLAYVTTQNISSEGMSLQLASPEDLVEENCLLSNKCPNRATSKSMPPGPNCPTSWQDAFIQCPRAYLLISNSVDYTMASGCLPSADVLPEIVRDLPAMGFIARLPWTSDIPLSESTRSLVASTNRIQRQSYPGSVRSPSFEGRDALDSINIETKTEKNLNPRRIQINYNSSPDATSDDPATSSVITNEHLLDINRRADQRASETTGPNLDFMDFGGVQSVSNNVTETCTFRIPLELVGHNLQVESPLDQQVFEPYGVTLPQSIKAIDSTIFDTFYRSGFEQNWAVQ